MRNVILLLSLIAIAIGTQQKTQPDCAALTAALEKRIEEQRHQLADWAGLIRYGSENTELTRPAAGENRVVFLGDEITERWGRNFLRFFNGKPYLNRGISGQTTAQMLVRFRQDVISLKPAVVVILAGSNDIASLDAPVTQGMMAENVMSMVELARANSIRVVIASITPVCDCIQKQTTLRPVGKILGANSWLKEYAQQSGSIYLDYYSALVEGRAFKKELTSDGLLPNEAGYAVMAPLAEKAVTEALRLPTPSGGARSNGN